MVMRFVCAAVRIATAAACFGVAAAMLCEADVRHMCCWPPLLAAAGRFMAGVFVAGL